MSDFATYAATLDRHHPVVYGLANFAQTGINEAFLISTIFLMVEDLCTMSCALACPCWCQEEELADHQGIHMVFQGL